MLGVEKESRTPSTSVADDVAIGDAATGSQVSESRKNPYDTVPRAGATSKPFDLLGAQCQRRIDT